MEQRWNAAREHGQKYGRRHGRGPEVRRLGWAAAGQLWWPARGLQGWRRLPRFSQVGRWPAAERRQRFQPRWRQEVLRDFCPRFSENVPSWCPAGFNQRFMLIIL